MTATTNSSDVTMQFWTEYVHRFSSVSRSIRTLAYVQRFIDNCRNARKNKSFFNTRELEGSKIKIIKQVQLQGFTEEIKALKQE
jgi:hypothetical protein